MSFNAVLIPAIRLISEKKGKLKDGIPSLYLFILLRPVVHSHWSPKERGERKERGRERGRERERE